MLILALDTTAVVATAAVCEAEDGAIKRYSLFTLKNGLTHSENLLPLTDDAFKLFGKTVNDADLIAVSAGPGSFTGVRIGVATVKGLAFTRDIPTAAVSTLDALHENVAFFPGIVCPVMDARRSQFYNALYDGDRKLTDDRCLASSEIEDELLALGKPALAVGDGAQLFASLCTKIPVSVASAACCDQNALSVALCGYRLFLENHTVSQKELKPVYLRMSQAERERKARENAIPEKGEIK